MAQKTLTLSVLDQDEVQAEKRLQLEVATETALAKEINDTFAEAEQMSYTAEGLFLMLENARVKIGTLLREAKDKVKHGQFAKWVETNCPKISERTARRCMSISKELEREGIYKIESLDDIKEYHKVLVRLGLKEPNVGHGQQVLHDFNAFALVTKTIATTRQKFNEIFEQEPLDDWEDEAKEQLKEQLFPLVQIYESL